MRVFRTFFCNFVAAARTELITLNSSWQIFFEFRGEKVAMFQILVTKFPQQALITFDVFFPTTCIIFSIRTCYANKDNTQTHEFRPLTKNVGQEKSQPFIFCEYFILSFQCVALGILPYFLHNVEIDLDGYKIWEKILLCSWRHK